MNHRTDTGGFGDADVAVVAAGGMQGVPVRAEFDMPVPRLHTDVGAAPVGCPESADGGRTFPPRRPAHGILAKIGVNSAGLGLHFNILGHRDDRVGGIPVHVLAALVLEEADNADQARQILHDSPITSSGSFMLFDTQRAVLLDISPAGIFEAPQVAEGTYLRTNHFLTAVPAEHEKSWLYQPDSGERHAFLRNRLAHSNAATDDQLLQQLVTGPGEPPVTCIPDMDSPMGRRWASLATVVLNPGSRTARVLDGTPAEHTTRPWRSLQA